MRISDARAQTQQQLEDSLGVNQAWVSRVERQTDMYLSTLRAFVEALGGHLELAVRFDDCIVRLDQVAKPDGVSDDETKSPATADGGRR